MKKLYLKIILILTIWISYFNFYKIFYPTITIDQTLKQLDDNVESFNYLIVYQQLWKFSWILLVIISIVLFKNEIKKIYNKIKGEI